MFKQLNELKDGGWKTQQQFAGFVKALHGVPEKTKHGASRDFFLDFPDKFIGLYEKSLSDHILMRWRNNKLLLYMVGGQPKLAKQLALKVVHHKENMGAVGDDSEIVEACLHTSSQFPDVDVELDRHHNTLKDEPPTINVRECMEYVTTNVDFDIVVKDEIFVKNEDLIESLAASENTVQLFDKHSNGK